MVTPATVEVKVVLTCEVMVPTVLVCVLTVTTAASGPPGPVADDEQPAVSATTETVTINALTINALTINAVTVDAERCGNRGVRPARLSPMAMLRCPVITITVDRRVVRITQAQAPSRLTSTVG
jgi:hypothetical protein